MNLDMLKTASLLLHVARHLSLLSLIAILSACPLPSCLYYTVCNVQFDPQALVLTEAKTTTTTTTTTSKTVNPQQTKQ